MGELITITALDLGTVTGWARYATTDGTPHSGWQSFKPSRYEGGGMRFLRFQRFLPTVIGTDPSTSAVWFEEVRRHAGTDAAHVYGGLLATLTSYCEQHDIPYQGVPVGTIKKHWTGKGNASKPDMIHACIDRGYVPENDNEADAIALMHYVLDTQMGGTDGG